MAPGREQRGPEHAEVAQTRFVRAVRCLRLSSASARRLAPAPAPLRAAPARGGVAAAAPAPLREGAFERADLVAGAFDIELNNINNVSPISLKDCD